MSYPILALALIGVLALTLYELVNELMNGPASKNPLCSKEDCRIAKRILVREAALSGSSVIEVTCEDKVILSTDLDLAEVDFADSDAGIDAEAETGTEAETAVETDSINDDTDAAQPNTDGAEND